MFEFSEQYPEIQKQLLDYINYAILTSDQTQPTQYKRELYKVYGQVLESYNQFYAIYRDICQNEEKNKNIQKQALLFDYTQEYYIAEKMLGWFEMYKNPTTHSEITIS